MKDGGSNKKQEEPDPANLDQNELASNQEVKPVPWEAGERLGAVTWISPMYNVYHKDAPSSQQKK